MFQILQLNCFWYSNNLHALPAFTANIGHLGRIAFQYSLVVLGGYYLQFSKIEHQIQAFSNCYSNFSFLPSKSLYWNLSDPAFLEIDQSTEFCSKPLKYLKYIHQSYFQTKMLHKTS